MRKRHFYTERKCCTFTEHVYMLQVKTASYAVQFTPVIKCSEEIICTSHARTAG